LAAIDSGTDNDIEVGFFDMDFALTNDLDNIGTNIDTEDFIAFSGEDAGGREANIAEAHDADFGFGWDDSGTCCIGHCDRHDCCDRLWLLLW
jgi:hypothetical protein